MSETHGTNGAETEISALEQLVHSGSFEESLAALESVVEHLERGQLSIADAVSWYEIGLGLMRRCSILLEQAELRISVLEETYGLATGGDNPWATDDA